MSQQIHDLFTSIAPNYDTLNTLLSLGIDRLWRRRAVECLRRHRVILDLCAGTLPLTRELLQINPTAQVTAVDFAQPMLDYGLQRLPAELCRRITTECTDFFQFTRPPESFDAAMCAYGLRNLDDNRLALQRIHQLLKRGGTFVLLEFFRPDRWYSWLFHRTYAQYVIPFVGWFVSRHRDAYRHLRDSVRGFYTLDQYVELLRETGFVVKTAQRLTGGVSGLIVAEKPSPSTDIKTENPLSRRGERV